jgi:hypothetical protein
MEVAPESEGLTQFCDVASIWSKKMDGDQVSSGVLHLLDPKTNPSSIAQPGDSTLR